MSRMTLFTPGHAWRAKAGAAAICWTLLLLALCFIPGKEIPDVRIPLADKWVHFILFGVFALLWLIAYPARGWLRLLTVFGAAVLLGWLVEVLQGQLTFLGRSQDNMDTLADAVGGLLGVLAYYGCSRLAKRSENA